MTQGKKEKLILWFDEVDKEDVPYVGGKNASLGEMIRHLEKKGIRIPGGFAVTSHAYQKTIQHAGIKGKIEKLLSEIDKSDVKILEEKGNEIRNLIKGAALPSDLEEEIRKAYRKMEETYGKNADVAARSSATAEDLPTASFAGQQETYLNINGEDELLDAVRNCFSSLFTNRAISYREDKGFDHSKVYISVGVQKMVRSDISCAGVAFSIDTETGFKDAVYINGSWGLGEAVVGGKVNPDQYYVFKPTLKKGCRPILEKRLGAKKRKFVYGDKGTKIVETSDEERNAFVISDDQILELAKWVCIIEEHYGLPMDVEWAVDGLTNDMYIVQARPETVHSQRDMSKIQTYVLEEEGKV
ncbi:MAG: phosphoenolpyruvate synthase, partial [Thermoplasmata archaeon]|nr:phosphoenolpyruvate synthase [Thermoplasmata archaeon]